MATIAQLTGGTGDVNPQLLNLTVTQAGVDVTTTLEQPLPIPRIGIKKGRSIVVEILWIQFNFADYVFVAGINTSYTALLSTSATAATVADPRTFAVQDLDLSVSAAPVSRDLYSRTWRQHFDDGAGHGFLVATDSIFLTLTTVLTAVVNAVNAKIAYRFKEVNLEEYIGIVAGQQ